MDDKTKKRITYLGSAFFGGFICILADLIQKAEASAVLLIGEKLEKLLGLPSPRLFAIVIILIIAASLPLIFEPKSKKNAFYVGASVLAILMTITPYQIPAGLKTEPSSVAVNLSVSTHDNKKVTGAVVTTIPLNTRGKKARSKMRGAKVKFYLDGGKYRLIVELAGYKTVRRTITIREGSPAQSISISMKPSSTPLFIQRILR